MLLDLLAITRSCPEKLSVFWRVAQTAMTLRLIFGLPLSAVVNGLGSVHVLAHTYMAARTSANNTRVSVGARVNVEARRCAFQDARQQENQGYRFALKLHTCTVPPTCTDRHGHTCNCMHVFLCMFTACISVYLHTYIQVWKEGEIVKKKGKGLLTFDHIYKRSEGWSISVCLKLFLLKRIREVLHH